MKKLVFSLPSVTLPRTKGEPFALTHDWTLVFRGGYYRLPAGFTTDGASIPRWLWWLCGTPYESPRIFAALVHDYLYGGGDPETTRADADDLYRDIQIALGVSRVKAYVEWLALRLCGWTHWNGFLPVRGEGYEG